MKKLFVLCALMAMVLLYLQGCGKEKENKEGVEQMSKIEGNWEGAILISDQNLPVVVEFQGEEGTISIPVQGIKDFPLSAVDFDDPSLHFEMSIQNQQLVFDGVLEQGEVIGTFTQQGQSFPFELNRTLETAEEEDEGTQTKIDVAGGAMNALILTPEGDGPFPVLLMLSGSGPTDKNGNSPLMPGKNNGLKMVAEELAEKGIATIRYDKRGVGDNASLLGKEEDLRFDDFIKDASAWLNYAKSQDEFSSVGVIGHSEGSLIAMIAAERQHASTFISLSGAGRPADEVLMEQLSEQLPEHLLEESKQIIARLQNGETVKEVSPELVSIFRLSVQPYLISWLAYNPSEELGKLEIPVLIAGGTTDLQVPIQDAKRLQAANDKADLLIVENMNHVLKTASADPAENISTYSNPDLPLADGLIEGIVEFLKQ